MSETEAKGIMEEVMKVLWLRDARASNRIQFAKCTVAGIEFEEPYTLQIADHESLLTFGLNPNYP
jgi:hypothetical protein